MELALLEAIGDLTWPDWPITHPNVAEIVETSKQRRFWRDVNVVLAREADLEAKRFLASDCGAASCELRDG